MEESNVLLLTGFGPYTTGQGLKLESNPTEKIVQNVSKGLPSVLGRVLPVVYSETKSKLRQLFKQEEPKNWIGLGYAPHRTTLDLEVLAINVEHAVQGDNHCDKPWNRPILDGAPLAYETSMDIPHVTDVFLDAGLEIQASFHSGTFLCNQVFYLGCHHVKTSSLKTAGFIHVPPMENFRAFEKGLKDLILSLENNE